MSVPFTPARTALDYQAVSAAGAVIATFGTPDQAATWADEKADQYPGCRIEIVRTRVTREVIFQHAAADARAA